MDLNRVAISELYWEFALAETQNDERHDRMYSGGLGSELYHRVRTNNRKELTPADWERLRATVLATRPEYLASLPSLELEWYAGSIGPSEIGALRIPKLEIFRGLTHSRRLAEFAAALDRGEVDAGLAVEQNYRRTRPAFDYSRMRGAPVVIGSRESGPFTVVEGMTRLSILSSLQAHSEPVPPGIRLLVGIGARAREWPFY